MSCQSELFDPAETVIEATRKTTTLFAVAGELKALLIRGEKIEATTLRSVMTEAFGGSDAEGLWLWKDAYEAQEIAGILFLRQFRPAMLKRDVVAQLAVLDKLQSFMMTQTRRSDVSVQYQQFSTPFVLARLCAEAARIGGNDVVLEPSAGTGILAIMAEVTGATVWLNEYEQCRYDILQQVFSGKRLGKHNAEYLNDLFDRQCQPSVVLMNPPFTNSPTMVKSDLAVTGRHGRLAPPARGRKTGGDHWT